MLAPSQFVNQAVSSSELVPFKFTPLSPQRLYKLEGGMVFMMIQTYGFPIVNQQPCLSP